MSEQEGIREIPKNCIIDQHGRYIWTWYIKIRFIGGSFICGKLVTCHSDIEYVSGNYLYDKLKSIKLPNGNLITYRTENVESLETSENPFEDADKASYESFVKNYIK